MTCFASGVALQRAWDAPGAHPWRMKPSIFHLGNPSRNVVRSEEIWYYFFVCIQVSIYHYIYTNIYVCTCLIYVDMLYMYMCFMTFELVDICEINLYGLLHPPDDQIQKNDETSILGFDDQICSPFPHKSWITSKA